MTVVCTDGPTPPGSSKGANSISALNRPPTSSDSDRPAVSDSQRETKVQPPDSALLDACTQLGDNAPVEEAPDADGELDTENGCREGPPVSVVGHVPFGEVAPKGEPISL